MQRTWPIVKYTNLIENPPKPKEYNLHLRIEERRHMLEIIETVYGDGVIPITLQLIPLNRGVVVKAKDASLHVSTVNDGMNVRFRIRLASTADVNAVCAILSKCTNLEYVTLTQQKDQMGCFSQSTVPVARTCSTGSLGSNMRLYSSQPEMANSQPWNGQNASTSNMNFPTTSGSYPQTASTTKAYPARGTSSLHSRPLDMEFALDEKKTDWYSTKKTPSQPIPNTEAANRSNSKARSFEFQKSSQQKKSLSLPLTIQSSELNEGRDVTFVDSGFSQQIYRSNTMAFDSQSDKIRNSSLNSAQSSLQSSQYQKSDTSKKKEITPSFSQEPVTGVSQYDSSQSIFGSQDSFVDAAVQTVDHEFDWATLQPHEVRNLLKKLIKDENFRRVLLNIEKSLTESCPLERQFDSDNEPKLARPGVPNSVTNQDEDVVYIAKPTQKHEYENESKAKLILNLSSRKREHLEVDLDVTPMKVPRVDSFLNTPAMFSPTLTPPPHLAGPGPSSVPNFAAAPSNVHRQVEAVNNQKRRGRPPNKQKI